MAIQLVMRATYRLLSGVLLTVLITSLFIATQWYKFLQTPLSALNSPDSLFTIDKGRSVKFISKSLAKQGVIEYPIFFEWLVLSQKASRQVQAGEYAIEEGLLPKDLLKKFTDGQVHQYAFTIVEGWDFKTLLSELHKHPNIVKTLKSETIEDIVIKLGLGYSHPEGLFYPETYHFPAHTTDIAFLKRANQSMNQYLETLTETFKPDTLKTPYEVLILASIIEKESSLDSEYHDIAGVYIRRLEKGMRLQADPTVNYAVDKPYTQPLTLSDLAFESPYNTYRTKGLPPTPIGMPSKKAIDAALNPALGSSLYFVATGQGGHQFSDTLAEHNMAVKAYRLWLKEQKAKGNERES